MDFFKYMPISEQFSATYWVQYLIGGLCFAIVFIFEAIALYTIATKNGYNNKWMAFIPFLNTYYIGVCAQKNKFYSLSAKTLGILAASIEAVVVLFYVFTIITQSLVKEYIVVIEDDYFSAITNISLSETLSATPNNLKWAAIAYFCMYNYILNIFDLIYLVVNVLLLICFYQTYACRRYVIFSIMSVLFPIMGILFFVVRNNKGYNYKEFVHAEQVRQYRQYQQFRQQNSNNPYNQNYNQNPYSRNQNDNPQGSGNNSDPFAEFTGSGNSGGESNNNPPIDPFEDFDK